MSPRTTVALLALLSACRKDEPAGTRPGVTDDSGPGSARLWRWEDVEAVGGGTTRALAPVAGGHVSATDAGLFHTPDAGETWTALTPSGLPEGPVTFLGRVGEDALLAWVHGAGMVRSIDGGASWAAVGRAPVQPLVAALNPRGAVVPFGAHVGDDGTAWLAGVGGLFRSADSGDTWTLVNLSTSGSMNVLFTDVSASGEEVVAVAQLADTILPSSFQGLLGGTVFRSTDGGASWSTVGDGLPSVAPMAVTHTDSGVCVATMDAGTWCSDDGGETWADAGGPVDAVAIEHLGEDALAVGSASRGVWAWGGGEWVGGGSGPVAAMAGALAVGVDGDAWAVSDGPASVSDGAASGTVHLALSFHTNYYHSYRGDENAEDGYGKDIRVIRTILDWLDAHPDAHGDWDIENTFSLDGWMASESPDILERIQARVDAGQDDVRIMSWNNGALANETRAEFDASVAWALDSNAAAFGEVVPGVQPQECMITPEQLGWYADHGIEWITLFYAANGFTALRQDVSLSGRALYNPVTLRDPVSGSSLVWVPAYHHADVLDHGGLKAWVQQIAASTSGDTLLLVHFDADAESWENFGGELDALEPLLEDGTVVYTNIQTYLDAHEAVETVDFHGDVADGTGDGFQSWAEKDVNHRLYTSIAVARDRAAAAELLAGDAPEVASALDAALEPRLLALSTTHFGLAAPYLHDDRVAAAWSLAERALSAADTAFAVAETESPVSAGTIQLVNARPSAGPAMVDITVRVPEDDWAGPNALVIRDATGAALPWFGLSRSTVGGVVQQSLRLVTDVSAAAVTTLTWGVEAGSAPVSGGLTVEDTPTVAFREAPFTECLGTHTAGALAEAIDPGVDARGVVAQRAERWTLGFCDSAGELEVREQAWAGLPGAVVVVRAQMGQPGDETEAESVALTPLACAGHAGTLSWRTHGGTDRSRPVRAGVDSWNGQAADGQVTLHCDDGVDLSVAHRVAVRSSIAFAPIRDRGGRTLVAPLGTLWGDGPWHDGRRTGGSGLGEVATALVGSQYRPAAPDWGGQAVVYELLVGDGIAPDTLDLFAHPPLIRVGEFAPAG